MQTSIGHVFGSVSACLAITLVPTDTSPHSEQRERRGNASCLSALAIWRFHIGYEYFQRFVKSPHIFLDLHHIFADF